MAAKFPLHAVSVRPRRRGVAAALRAVRGALLLALCVLVVPAGAQTLNGFDLSASSIPARAIARGGPPKDGIPAIDAPLFVPAAQSRLAADDRVLGLVQQGVARAYPVRILNWHEVVNDRYGDVAVAVTYCPLCGTGMAFSVPAGVGPRGFGISGLLYNSDVLLYDRATQSLWSQIMQTAIAGPLRGTRLQALPLTHTRWADWRARHPATVVLSRETGYTRDYDRDPYAGYDRVQRLLFDVEHRDGRFPLKEWVLGVELDGVTKAYPFSVLARAVDARGELLDTLGGRRLRIRYDAGHGSAEAFDAQGRQLPATMAYWFAWVAFHPKSEVLAPTR